MNTNLIKYLSDVFCNEVQRNAAIVLKEGNLKASPDLLDRNMKQFVVDKRSSLGLDELL